MDDYKISEVNKTGLNTEDVTRFIQKTWKRGIALSVPNFYNWQFIDSPDSSYIDNSIIVTDNHNRIYGFMGLNPRQFNITGTPHIGAELTTWMICEEAQGKGLGKQILKYLKSKYDILAGMGISEMALRVYLTEGFKWIKSIPRYVRIFNPERVLTFSEVSQLGLKLIEKHSYIPRVDYSAQRVDTIDNNEIIVQFQERFNCFSRNKKYIEWRYIKHPIYEYKLFYVNSNDSISIVILRVEEKNEFRIIHIIDIIGEDNSIHGVISFIEDYAKSIDADFADFFCTSAAIYHHLWCHGWFSMLDDTYIKIPHLYYPIEVRTPPTTSLILWSKLNNRELFNMNNLYITKGDCDLDRPTMDFLTEKEQYRHMEG